MIPVLSVSYAVTRQPDLKIVETRTGRGLGKTETKQEFLASLKSGQMKTDSFEMDSMQVKMVGGAAVVQGSDRGKGTSNGKDSSGKYVRMDVVAKRDGKWMAARSQTARVK